MVEPLVIDGSHGEGDGQILRTALSLAAITGRALSMRRIRANRRQPGLAAQHLTAVRAAAAPCRARIHGDELGSQSLDFAPGAPVLAGDYAFDVAEAREGGSPGSVTLVLQTLLLPLAFTPGESCVVLRGGTHLPWSPSFDYTRDVWLPALSSLAIRASIELDAWGWFPAGRGQVRSVVKGSGGTAGALLPLNLIERGRLRGVTGRAPAANLPAHIPQRMDQRAEILLRPLGIDVGIQPERVRAASPGAGIFLTAEYDNIHCGVSALGTLPLSGAPRPVRLRLPPKQDSLNPGLWSRLDESRGARQRIAKLAKGFERSLLKAANARAKLLSGEAGLIVDRLPLAIRLGAQEIR